MEYKKEAERSDNTEPIIRNAERAAYILGIPDKAFREQSKRKMNTYSKVANASRNRRVYEFYPYLAAQALGIPVETLEERDREWKGEKDGDNV